MKRFSKTSQSTFSTKKIASLAMLTAMAIASVALIRLRLIPSAPHLEYDPADIFILFAAFMYGPFSALIMTVAVSVLQGLTLSASSGWIGILMHIFATGFFSIIAGTIYKKKKTLKGAIIALSAGSLAMIVIMVVWNIVFTPIFFGMPRAAVYPMILPVIIPFNAMKAIINSVVTLILYKKVSKLFKRIFMEKEEKNRLN